MPYALDLFAGAAGGHCPYHESGSLCRASYSAMTVDRRRARNYCGCEDYDLCPLFLSRVLRGSRPRYSGAGRLDLQQK